MTLLCVIPARCGSKGLKLKNIVTICDKPMLAYTTEVAIRLKENGYIDTIVVSTDCSDIAQEAKRCGVEVPFLRPVDISGDKSKTIDVILHALDYYKGKEHAYDSVIVLQPTSPLRSYDDIKNSIEIFNRNQSDSLISVYKEETINELIMYNKKNDFAIPISNEHNKGIRRQEHGATYIRNGAIYIANEKFIRNERSLISNTPLMFEMSKKRSINIDTLEDLEYVRYLLCK
jgi:CMP-N,N'-diacetyllegionaminic acid synthase